MKKVSRLLVSLIISGIAIFSIKGSALSYGYNLIFPAARRSAISGHTFNNPPSHQAYDYRFSNGTKVAAATAGTVQASDWDFDDDEPWPCDGTINSRGNYIILDHGGGLTTWYFHLSNTGTTPTNGTSFYQGAYMAYADNNGCSGGAHLHFSTKLNGTPFDPYADNHWVGGKPIPMGYRNQNGTVNGPYALSDTKIRNKWLALEGLPGSPVGGYYYVPSCLLENPAEGKNAPVTSGYAQNFEQGIIQYCGTGSAQYLAYDSVFLPDIRSDRSTTNGWESTIVVRNDSPYVTDVSIIIYHGDGTIRDSRTYKDLAANKTWTLEVEDVVFDWLIEDGANPPYGQGFYGSAIVAADNDVSVAVIQHHIGSNTYAGYTGVRQPLEGDYLPIIQKNNNGWFSELYIQNATSYIANVTVEFKQYSAGSNCTGGSAPSYNIPPNGLQVVKLANISCVGTTFIGSAFVSTNQPLAISAVQAIGTTSVMESSSLGGTGGNIYAPLIQNYNNQWISGVALQNATLTNGVNLTLDFYHAVTQGSLKINGQWCDYAVNNSVNAFKTFIIFPPPGTTDCATILSGLMIGRIGSTPYHVSANINQLLPGTDHATDYRALASPSLKATIPYLKRDSNWFPGIAILNTTTSSTEITITLYNTNGSVAGTPKVTTLGARQTFICLPGTSGCIADITNFEGSAVVTSTNQAIAVIVNNYLTTSNNDGILTYEAFNQ